MMKPKQHQRFTEAIQAEQRALEKFAVEMSERNPKFQHDLAPVVHELLRRREAAAKAGAKAQVWSDLGRERAKKRHKEDYELQKLMRAKWAEGNYTSRNECARQEWKGLGFRRESTARRALLPLRNRDRS